MSLPENGAPWPPREWSTAYREIRVDDAWYSGDRTRLADVYRHAPRREDGRRRLWARHRHHQPGQRDTRLHIPLAADIATTSADLLFSEPPVFTVDTPATQCRLDELTEAGGIANTLLEAAEVGAALGGVFLRVTWDASLVERPLLTVMHPDTAAPEFRFGMLTAVTFWRKLTGDDTTATVWRHLERHEPGRIVHGLYRGTDNQLGTRVPLTEHPATVSLVDSLGPDGDTIATGIDALTAAYVPNIRPNRRHRGSPLGRSDFQGGVHDLFDALDETWTSWLRDIRLARARLIVPDGYLRDHGPGRGASFDDDREIWQSLNIPPTEAAGITLSQFAIRVAEHQSTADAIVQQAVRSAGYSVQSFGLGDVAAATATEVTARERRSMITRDKKSRYWQAPLADMLHVLLMLDRALFTPSVVPERPRVVFGDSVSEDPQSVAQTLSLLQQAQAVSTDTKVRLLHPDWDDTAVQAEVDRILAETGQAVPDPMQAGTLD
ncbi:phage portal protein [Streptomyces sp. NBRC 110611]|uniref:phage portal protein n=1 Tax=Streptomyces sp. NBRC 110611 TaxID=1621259 RepID=UPI000829EB86|nr:phage portal protein [Streptomyces sp. NBRC 110611]